MAGLPNTDLPGTDLPGTGLPDPLSINQRLALGKPLLCSWMMIPGGFLAGAFATAGLSPGLNGEKNSELGAVLLDMQHGMIGYRDMVEMVQAINGAGSLAIVRPPLDDFAMVSRALDVGASGIVFPMINTPDEARRLVAAAKFPPVGERSWGAYLGQSQMGLSKQDYLARANDLNAVFAMVETRQAMDNLDEICAVDGLDGVFVGPNDLSISLTRGKAGDINHRDVQKALPEIVGAARRADIFAGIYVGDRGDIPKYDAMGFNLMPALTDASFINQGVTTIRRELGEQ